MKKKIILLIGIFFIGINNIYAKEIVKFSDCVDGDTIKVLVDNKKYTIRMLAVDTPESVHPTKEVEYYGKEASDYTCNLVKNAKQLEIEYDDASDKKDKYDRLLVWVFVDGKLLQKELISNGYAKVAYLYGDYKYTKDLEDAQELASSKNLGIWNDDAKNKYSSENYIKEESDKNKETKNSNKTDNKTSASSIADVTNYTTKDIIIIGILLLIIVFVGDKSIKNKAKKKLKKYLG